MKKKDTARILILSGLGAAAGFVNGLLGTGGGIVLLFGAFFLNRKGERDQRDLFASTAVVTLVLSTVSAVIYFTHGALPFQGAVQYYLPALFGGAVGAMLLDRLPVSIMKKIFAAVVILAGAIMVFR